MKITIFFLFSIIILQTTGIAQLPERQPEGGGAWPLQQMATDEIVPQQRKQIVEMLQANEWKLQLQGLLTEPTSRIAATLFSWPIKQASFSTDNGYYGISNYVDENPAFPNALLDYNCGSRTYDASTGYNHAGTDIFLWPFSWQKMLQNAVLVVAAAPGVIIGKADNNSDTSCAMCTNCSWNAIYVRHSDGSVAWYGHLKKNSQTAKAIGEPVALGEVLGVVGSSGSSTAPHLHFEVYANSSYTQLVDPWAGNCNAYNGNTSWWATQQAYRVSTINKVMTHGAPPVQGCFSQEAVNEKVNFVKGETVFLGTYYRDQLSGQQSVHTIYRPDNSVYTSWVQVFGNTYDASWWYYTFILPNAAPPGTWRYSVTYINTQTISTAFNVNSVLPVILNSFQGFKNGNKVTVNFTTSIEDNIRHYNLLRSTDGQTFKKIQTIPAKRNAVNAYVTDDNFPENGTAYYQLEIVENDGSSKYSAIRQVVFNLKESYLRVTANPFKNSLQLTVLQPATNVSFDMINMNGQLVYRKKFSTLQGTIALQPNIVAGVYLLVMKSDDKILDKQTVIKHQ